MATTFLESCVSWIEAAAIKAKLTEEQANQIKEVQEIIRKGIESSRPSEEKRRLPGKLWEKDVLLMLEEEADYVFPDLTDFVEIVGTDVDVGSSCGGMLIYWRWVRSVNKMKLNDVGVDRDCWDMNDYIVTNEEEEKMNCSNSYMDKDYLVLRIIANYNGDDTVYKIFVTEEDEPKAREMISEMVNKTKNRIELP